MDPDLYSFGSNAGLRLISAYHSLYGEAGHA